ncbi:hypothetical protein H8B09_28725 [Paenibacillus sp. PR3]|uniref:Uncharacterized protein n=1 Tax=Paenibacillus terricola TaxID=2763503 RepID=A0ABR8N3I6_9BACL|nr:hypothetical protein [Paenibacillus terricola]MBD3922728.1 hypothetical protein [Paenibacillus terricola]
MYQNVEFPRKVTEKWLTKAFAPLKDHLDKHHSDNEKEIMAWMEFKGNWDGKFIYENTMTQGQIIFAQDGRVISIDDNALHYKYELGYERIPVVTDFYHPNVDKWIEQVASKKKASIFREELRLFLQHIWGPMANFDFSDLNVGYPLQGSGSSFCLYVYPSRFHKLIAFQFVGEEIVKRTCSLRQYHKFEESEREFAYQGWQLTTLIHELLQYEPELSTMREVIKKGFGLADWRVEDDTEFVLSTRVD